MIEHKFVHAQRLARHMRVVRHRGVVRVVLVRSVVHARSVVVVGMRVKRLVVGMGAVLRGATFKSFRSKSEKKCKKISVSFKDSNRSDEN